MAERIRVSLTPGERSRIAGSRPQVTPAAYESYVRGAYFLDKGTEASFQTAIGHFAKAIDADPTFAAAYAGMAECYASLGYFGGLAPEIAFPQARAAASKALALDSTLADGAPCLGVSTVVRRVELRRGGSGVCARGRARFHQRLVALAARHVLDGDESERRGDRLGRAGPAARPVVAHNPVRIRALVLQRPPVPGGDRPGQGRPGPGFHVCQGPFWIGMAEEQLGRSDEAIRELRGDHPEGGPTSAYLAALGHVYATSGGGARRSASWTISRLDRSRAMSRRWISRRSGWVWAIRLPPWQCWSRAVRAHDGGLSFSPSTPATIRCDGIPDSSACSDGSGFPTA